MKKSQVSQFRIGTAEYVIAHAKWQKSRGRNPSMPYLGYNNPRTALAVAKALMRIIDSADGVIRDTSGIPVMRLDSRPDMYKVTMGQLVFERMRGLLVKMSDNPDKQSACSA